MKTKEKLMNNVAYYLYQNLTSSYSYHSDKETANGISFIDVEGLLPHIESAAKWLEGRMGSINTLSLSYLKDYPIRGLDCSKDGVFTGIRMNSSKGFYQFIDALEILSTLNEFNETIGQGKALYIKDLSEYIQTFSHITPINSPKFFDLISEGCEKYVEFGMYLLGKIMPTNTYLFDLYEGDREDRGLTVEVFDLYEVHGVDEPLVNTLFTTKEIGQNGIDILYDEIFELKLRLLEEDGNISDKIRVSISRKDRSAFSF